MIKCFFILSLFLMGCEREQSEPKEERVNVKVVEVVPKTVSLKVEATGIINGIRNVTVVSKAEGEIVEVNVALSDRVKKGDVLVRVEDEIERLTLIQAEARLEEAVAELRVAQKELERSKTLFSQGNITEIQLENAQLRVERAASLLKSAEASFGLAKRRLSDCRIKSPISGSVAAVYVEMGETLSPGAPVASIVDLSKVKIEVGLTEEEIVHIKKGQSVLFKTDAYPEKTFSGVISAVGVKPRPKTSLFPVEILADNLNLLLKSGMVAKCEILYSELRNKIVIPYDAVIEHLDQRYVFCVEESRAKKVPVEVLFVIKEKAVVKGLKAGDRLVVAGKERLKEGSFVRVR